ncbi:MAG: hypothetical protein K2L37_06015, partial [Lactobacillus sp.]|nr:hypothetical protein [Lactobacillus sp.]
MKRFGQFLSVVVVLMLCLTVVLAACDPQSDNNGYTRHNYLSVTPSTWNELDSTDSNNDAIMSYIGSAFFEYDFQFEGGKFKADGSINAEGIVEGAFDVKYAAATALADVTSQYGSDWGLSEKQVSDGGYIWKITLRNDLTWDDGTPIKAGDFVYTMQEQLNPKFNLGRSDSYYANAVKIKNAREYLYQGRQGWFSADTPYTAYDASLAEKLIFRMGAVAADNASAADKVQASLRTEYQNGFESLGLNATQSAGEYILTLFPLLGASVPDTLTIASLNALE